ncbi:MAG: hypothetical protein LBF94_02865 [Puniceicoccales bacterium]|jgi:hypothetical protein|nr:hypothetical protein [Puniceicoccales bacterium]
MNKIIHVCISNIISCVTTSSITGHMAATTLGCPGEGTKCGTVGLVGGTIGNIIGTIIASICRRSITASSAYCFITGGNLVGIGLGIGAYFARKKLMHRPVEIVNAREKS